MKILLEMRPALGGHAGIPQEARLLFRALNLLPGIEAEGLIQSGDRALARGLPPDDAAGGLPMDVQVNRLSRVVVSLQVSAKPKAHEVLSYLLDVGMAAGGLVGRRVLGMQETLWRFDATHFRDFLWRALFSRTLPVEDFDQVTRAGFRIACVPWTVMHFLALATRKLGHAVYPRLNTRDFDVMIAETPYPGRVARRTRLVVRYHDAIPVLMPHTISDRAYHQASHYEALRRNVADGAHFACVSDATRRDLVSIFPQAEDRSVTIHNMVSHHYFPEEASPRRIPEILRARIHSGVRIRGSVHEFLRPYTDADLPARPLDFLLMVSTIEPRKNHTTLLAAWELLRAENYPGLKLVLVGMLGWEHKPIVARLRPWLERGEVFMLEDVPASELRLLYRQARATICPSYGEGFDFSGVEAMRCGGAVVASDIPVHRDIFAHAADYFIPYAAGEAAAAISRIIDPAQAGRREFLVQAGAEVSARYLPEVIMPQWQAFLQRMQY